MKGLKSMEKDKVLDLSIEMWNFKRLAFNVVTEPVKKPKGNLIRYAGITASVSRVETLIECVYKKAVATCDQWTIKAVTKEVEEEYRKAEKYYYDIIGYNNDNKERML